DHILFQGGATFNGTIVLAQDDIGAADNPITIGSYGDNGGGAYIVASNNGLSDGMLIYDTAAIDIVNLHIVGAGIGANVGSGVNCINDLPGSVKKTHLHMDWIDVYG